MNNKYKFAKPELTNPLLLVVVVARTVAAVYMLVDPVWGFIVTTLFDYLDSVILLHVGGMKRTDYTTWDKYLDWVGYVFMVMIGYTHSFGWILILFFIHRLIGQILYERTKKGIFFILFPNIFEMAFVWFTLGEDVGLTQRLSGLHYFAGFAALSVFKMAQELMLHFYWPNRVKTKGYPNFMRSWGLNDRVYH